MLHGKHYTKLWSFKWELKFALRSKEKKILLIKRSAKYGQLVGQWDIVGGRIKPGKSLFENLSREIFEEIGVNIDFNELKPKLLKAQDIFRPDYHV